MSQHECQIGDFDSPDFRPAKLRKVARKYRSSVFIHHSLIHDRFLKHGKRFSGPPALRCPAHSARLAPTSPACRPRRPRHPRPQTSVAEDPEDPAEDLGVGKIAAHKSVFSVWTDYIHHLGPRLYIYIYI